MKQHKLALYNIEWQVLRVGLAFTSMETVEDSCERLANYLAAPLETYDTMANKLWRVINLLNATVMGINGQLKRVRTPEQTAALEARIKRIQDFRQPLQDAYHLGDKDFKWDQEMELESMRNTPQVELRAVWASLTKRKSFAADFKQMDVAKTRPELLHYLKLLATALHEGGK